MSLEPHTAARNLREDCTVAIGHVDRVGDNLAWALTLVRYIDPELRRQVDRLISDAHTLKVAISALATEADLAVWRGDRR